ncbi:MAG: CapA family protein, partial [Streptosporangiaceae bacterium]
MSRERPGPECAIPPADPGARPQFFDPARPLARELDLGIADGFTLAAVGDCVTSRPLSGYLRDPGFATVIERVTSADVRYGNLETVIADIRTFRGYPQASDADWALLGQPGVAGDLASLGFQLLSRANNHALDWGIEGMRETSRWLDAVGLVHAGTGERRGLARAPRYLEAPQGRIALVSFTSSYRPTSDALPDRGAAPGRPGVSALGVSPIELVPQALFDALKATPG